MLNERSAQQFISVQELKDDGYSYYKIGKFVESGDLARVNKHFYENLAYSGEPNDFYATTAYSEKSVVCLLSAAVYYGLSLERQSKIDVALPRQTRTPNTPEWPAMRFYLFSEPRYELGIKIINENGNVFQIYDMEKTVCDILFYRNKLGFEVAVDVIRNYMQHKDRDINKLTAYADMLREKSVMRQFVEVLV